MAYKITFPKGTTPQNAFELWVDKDSYPRFRFDATTTAPTISTGDGASPLSLLTTGTGTGTTAHAAPYIVAGVDAPSALKSLANITGDGTVVGDTAALVAAFAAAPNQPVIGFGTFVTNTSLRILDVNNVSISGDMHIFTPDSAYPTPAIEIGGHRTLVTQTGLTGSTLAQGTTQINVTTSLVAGDWVALTMPDVGYGSRPAENFIGETMQVESNTAGVLTFKTPFRQTYTLSGKTLELWKLSPALNVRIDGLNVYGAGTSGNSNTGATNRERMLVVSYALAPTITNCYVEGPYAREGIAVYECLYPTIKNITYKDVNDIAGPAGVYEAYAVRVQGCEGALVENVAGSGSRHAVEINGGQSAYGLTSPHTRPLSYGTIVRNVNVTKSWGAAVGDHPGAVGTTFENIYANGCSGAVFSRGSRTRIRNVTMLGGHHFVGPYNVAQGNDHCITLGEQQRDGSGNADNTTRDGISGTGVIIDGVVHDMTGNANVPAGQASTSHTVHAVHPLVNATIDLGYSKPTGNGVNAVGMFNHDVRISGTVDCTASFPGAGRALVLSPAATSPTVSTGQYNKDIRAEITAISPRNPPVVIAGSADTAARSDRIDIRVKVEGLGSGLTSAGPAIILDANPNGTTGQFGHVNLRDLELSDFVFATAVNQASASITALSWFGVNRYSDGDRVVETRSTIGAAQALTRTAVKTATTYTAAAGELVPVDTTSNAVTITLPTTPADKTVLGVKHIIQGAQNLVTVACGGSDVLNRTGGSTSVTLTRLASVFLQYASSSGVWTIVANDLGARALVASRVSMGGANYPVKSTDRYVVGGTIPGGGIIATLPSLDPATTTVPDGWQIVFHDNTGTANASNPLGIAVSSGDTALNPDFLGAGYVVGSAYGSVVVTADVAGRKWEWDGVVPAGANPLVTSADQTKFPATTTGFSTSFDPVNLVALRGGGVVTADTLCVPNKEYLVSTAVGNVTMTLPNNPVDNTRVRIKHYLSAGTRFVNVVTHADASAFGGVVGTDTFDDPGGTTTLLVARYQGSVIEAVYKTSTGLWTYAYLSTEAAIDNRYLQIPAGSNGDLLERQSGLWAPRDKQLLKADLVIQETDFATGILGQSLPRWASTANAGVLSTGRLTLVRVWLPIGTVVTNIKWRIGTTAVGTPTHWWFSLHDNATRALLRQTSDQGSGAGLGASAAQSLALTSPFTTTYTGYHYVGIMVTATTVPSLMAAANGAAADAPIVAGNSTTGLTTTAPNPAGALTGLGFVPQVEVS